MFLDISATDFEKMARAGFMDNVRLRAQSIDTARARCLALGLFPVSATEYRLGDPFRPSAVDIHYNLVRLPSGFWLIRQKK